MSQTKKIRIQSRVDTAMAWAEENPILLDKEIGYVRESGQYKIGDGETGWCDLPFAGGAQIITVQGPEEIAPKVGSIIPKENEEYIIKYMGMKYYDSNGVECDSNPIYVHKIGDGITGLSELPMVNSFTAGNAGKGSAIHFVEADLYSKGDDPTNFKRPTATAKGAIALGRYNRALAECSVALNYNNKVEAINSFASGQANKIGPNAKYSFVTGLANETVSEAQFVAGMYANIDANDAFVIGNGSAQKGKQNAFRVNKDGRVYGHYLEATEDINAGNKITTVDLEATGNIKGNSLETIGNIKGNSLEIANNITGNKNLNLSGEIQANSGKLGTASFVQKDSRFIDNFVSGEGSATIGGNNQVYGKSSIALITSNTIPEKDINDKPIEHVFIAGHNNTATHEHQVIVGTYSTPQPGDRFIVGNGRKKSENETEDTYSNAFVVETNGNIRIGGNKLTLGETTLTETKLKDFVNGDALFRSFHVGGNPPENTKILWIDTTTVTGGLKYHNGVKWTHVPVAAV